MEKIKENWLMLTVSLVVGLVLGVGLMFVVKGGASAGGSVSVYPPKSGGDWLAKVDDYTINKKDFEEGYNFFLSQIPEQQRASLPPENVIKEQYLETLIGQYVITIKAIQDGLLKDPEADLLLKTALRQAIYQIYMNKKMPQDKSVLMPSKPEIDSVAMQYAAQFDKMGLNAEQRRQYVTQQLMQTKMQQWISTYVSQAKENFKVKRNTEALQKLGVSPSMGSQIPGMGGFGGGSN